MEDAARVPRSVEFSLSAAGAQAGGFRLMRYFTITTLVAFAIVAAALYVLQRMEETFFEQVQRDQSAYLAQAQAQLARQHEDAARSSLLAVHEASHVNLTKLVANMLWKTDFAPFVAGAQRVAIDHCRAMPADSAAYGAPLSPPTVRSKCFADVGRRITALPGFKALDTKTYAAMRSSSVFKIKVFDLRGITVYSSEHGQIGEDAIDNRGWQSATHGQAASELTHRDKFSAFERVVENRDLISSYVPVRAAGRDEVVGVFEIYADVTPFLAQIKTASKTFADLTAANEASVAQTARSNEDKVHASSDRFLGIVGGLLALLYASSLLIVRIGQRIIDKQSLEQEQSARREQLWHREKMAALAAMAANVSHEVGNPLAIISGLAQEMADRGGQGDPERVTARLLLEQTSRIARMTRQIADFATARGEAHEWVDVNAIVKAVCDFLGFDRRFRATPIEFRPGDRLPAREVVPDHLNEVMMNLLQACVQGGPCERIRVETKAVGDSVTIRVNCDAAPASVPAFSWAGLEPVRRRVVEMGGQLSVTGLTVEVMLSQPADKTLAA
jgi:signal transduction histidine kinase